MKHTQQLWYKMNKIVWFELLLLNLVYCRMILLIRLFTIPLIVTFHSKSSNKCYSHVVNWLKIIALALFCFCVPNVVIVSGLSVLVCHFGFL